MRKNGSTFQAETHVAELVHGGRKSALGVLRAID